MKTVIDKNILIGFSLSLLALIVMTVLSFKVFNTTLENTKWIAHTYHVQKHLTNLLLHLDDAETGQRGYIITGKQSYLEPYLMAIENIQDDLNHLKKLTEDNPSQQGRFPLLENQIAEKRDELKKTIHLRRNLGFKEAREVVMTDIGKNTMDDIRRIIQEMFNEEQSLLDTRLKSEKKSIKYSKVVSVFLLFVLTLSLSLLFFLIRREGLKRRQAEDTLRRTNDELEHHIRERTKELAQANQKLREENEYRKQVAKALRESEEKYRGIFENAQVGLWRTRISDGKLLECNDRLAHIFAYKDRNEYKDNFIATEHYLDAGTQEEMLAELKKKSVINNFEIRTSRKDGAVIWVRISAKIDADKDYLEGIATDITEQKVTEENNIRLENLLRQAQKMETIGTLAGGMAHEFNNILVPIFGYAELAKESIPEGSLAIEDLDELIKSAEIARELVEQILIFSRTGEDNLNPVEIVPIINDAIKLIRFTLPTSIELQHNIDPDCGMVKANSTQIHQVLMNLCTNAWESMGGHTGTIKISLLPTDVDAEFADRYVNLLPGKYVLLSVSDTGSGIESEILDRIFDPFFTTRKDYGGTGLGMSVVHGIVSGHGGIITVESEPGNGTTFHIYLPQFDKKTQNIVERDTKTKEVTEGKERLLFVDDESAITPVAERILTKLGYDVTVMSCGQEALEEFLVNPQKYDLVVTDYSMPKMTGLELSRSITNVRPDIPIILISGLSNAFSSEEIKKEGIREYVKKPFSFNYLAKIIRQLLDE